MNFGDALTEIGRYAFDNCESLESLEFGDGLISIGGSAFGGCRALSSVKFGNSKTEIGHFSFGNCFALANIDFGDGVTSIGGSAFYNCWAITSVELGPSLAYVEDYAFKGCSGMVDLKIADGTDPISLGSEFFDGYPPKNIYIGRNYQGEDAFRGLSVSSIVVGNLVTSIPESAFAYSVVDNVRLGSGLIEIPDRAFYQCSGLTEIVVPANVSSIGESAFANCDLKSVSIGCGMASIADNAFNGNNALESLNVTAVTPPFAQDNVFSYYLAPLYVPTESIDAYSNSTSCWNLFNCDPLVAADGLTLANDGMRLIATVTPEDATLPYVFFRSSDPEVAIVDNNGLVTFVNPESSATCEIYAETRYADGPVASVTVSASGISGLENVIATPAAAVERPNDIYTLQGVCLKRNATQADIDALTPGIYIVAGKKLLVR